MKTMHVIVKGRVQGVCFRDYTQRQARLLELTGWVRNKADGTVESVFRGNAASVDKMLQWLWQGSPMSKVEAVESRVVDEKINFEGFEVRY